MRRSDAIVAGGHGEPRVRLIRFGLAAFEYLLSTDVLATRRLALAEAERFPQLGRAFFNAAPRPLIAGIEDYFGELMARGFLKRGDRFMAARHFMDLTVFGVYQRRLLGVSDDLTAEQTDNHDGHPPPNPCHEENGAGE